MNNKLIFLMAYFFCVYAIEEEYEVEVELARKSACYFIKHSKSGCVLGRPNKQAKKMTICKHDHDELLQGNLENGSLAMFCIYDQDKNLLGYPLIISEDINTQKEEYRALYEGLFNTLNSAIRPKAMYGEITMNQGKPVLSFYDKSNLWITDYSGINPGMFSESKRGIEISSAGRQQLSKQLDLNDLKTIENKTNGKFTISRFNFGSLVNSFNKLKAIL